MTTAIHGVRAGGRDILLAHTAGGPDATTTLDAAGDAPGVTGVTWQV